ncbi:MAG: S9 family peptidase, partial [Verrucomicrobia bacterium]
DVDLEANARISHLWIVPASGGESRRLNPTPNHEERPRFSPDGKRLIWTSKATDPTQIWMCDFDSGSGVLVGKPHRVTNLSTGADGGIWSPDGKNIVFVSAVYPDCKDDACNKQRNDELKKSKIKAKIFSRLFYRHWSAFTEFKRSHLFVQSADAVAAGLWPASPASSPSPSTRATGERLQEARDLTPGDHDVPPFNLGGQDMYAISPDSQEVAYTSNIDEVEATSTNDEIFVVPIDVGHASGLPTTNSQAGGSRYPKPKKISTSPGADTTPLYSPNGKSLAWRSQARAGFEADKWRLLVQDRQLAKTRDLTEKFDRSVGSFAWKPDSTALLFAAEDHGGAPIFGVSLGTEPSRPVGGGAPELQADDLVFGGDMLFFTRMSARAPNEIWRMDSTSKNELATYSLDSALKRVTHMNDALLSQIDMQPLEPFTFKGANDEEVQGFMVKPSGFDPNMEKTYGFIDKNREAALGASYGGYMANWILGHTNRFKCIVSHDGMFNTESAYGTTEELWFPEWEFHGPPWKNRELYQKFSPHLFADKFKTPTLVVHGQNDYRLDVSEGFQLFTTLQRLKIPSKFLYFPDEGHWVLKPQNSQLWYKTVNDWVDQWCK